MHVHACVCLRLSLLREHVCVCMLPFIRFGFQNVGSVTCVYIPRVLVCTLALHELACFDAISKLCGASQCQQYNMDRCCMAV